MSLKELFEQKLSPQAYYPIDNNGVMLYFPKMQEAVSSENDLLGIHLAVEYTLKNVCIDNAKIVCFGNNLYGREVNYSNFPHQK